MAPEPTSTLTIREAVPEDLPALVALSKKTFSDKFAHLYDQEDLAFFLEDSHGEANYRRWLADPENLIRVAEDGAGDLKAYLFCSPLSLPADNPLPGAVELKRVYVDRALQGQGTGSRFIAEALDWARARGAPEIYLSVFSENYEAQRLYHRLGWEKVGEFIFPVGRHRDREFLLRLPL